MRFGQRSNSTVRERIGLEKNQTQESERVKKGGPLEAIAKVTAWIAIRETLRNLLHYLRK